MEKFLNNRNKLIVISTLFTLANAMSAVFVNVFLYVYTKSLVVMTIYTCIRMALYSPFFYLSGKIGTKKNYGLTLSLGLVFFMLHLIMVLFFNDLFETNRNLVYLAAIISGIGEGFYWFSQAAIRQFVAPKEDRNRYLGIIAIFNNISSLVAPVAATWIISNSISDMEGYISIFKIVLVIYVVIAIISFTLKIEKSGTNFTIMDKIDFKNPKFNYLFTTNMLGGLRDAIIQTLAGLLIYNATGGSGSIYSQLLAVFAFFTIGAYWVIMKKMRNNNLDKWFKFGSYLISSSTIVLILCPNLFGAIYYGIVNAIASPMFAHPHDMVNMGIIAEYKSENLMPGVIIRQYGTTSGRVIGNLFIVLLFVILGEPYYLPISVIILSLTPIVTYYYHKRLYPQIEKDLM